MVTPYDKSSNGMIASAKRRTRKRDATALEVPSFDFDTNSDPCCESLVGNNRQSKRNSIEHLRFCSTSKEQENTSENSKCSNDEIKSITVHGDRCKLNAEIFSPALQEHSSVTLSNVENTKELRKGIEIVFELENVQNQNKGEQKDSQDCNSSTWNDSSVQPNQENNSQTKLNQDGFELHNSFVELNDSSKERKAESVQQSEKSLESIKEQNNEICYLDSNCVDLSIDGLEQECSHRISISHYHHGEFDPYLFMKFLPPYEEIRPFGVQAYLLPEKQALRQNLKQNTLVLDLDETLVHCTVEPIANPDHTFNVRFNHQDFNVYARKRPDLDSFLLAVSELFEIVVFTASQRVYAEVLLDTIDPEHKLIMHRLYRDACLEVDGNYLKDLNVLGRDLKRTVLVDNSPYAYGYQISNGVPIESWFDDDKDKGLTALFPLLKRLSNEDDVRPVIEDLFKTKERVDRACIPFSKFSS